MKRDKPISPFAKLFVQRKLDQFANEAIKGCGCWYELYAQNFSDSVDRLASIVKRPDLRAYVLDTAEKTGIYTKAEEGRWSLDVENNELRCTGGPRKPTPVEKYGAPARTPTSTVGRKLVR